jgi:hypothetical protein
MPDDWMLAQGTVEFRQTERDHATGRARTPAARCGLCGDPAYLCGCASDFDAAAGVSPETEPAAAKEAS